MSRFNAACKVVMGALLSASVVQVVGAAEDPPLPTNSKEVAARFKAADKNGDGKLTLEEAKVGMPRIAGGFEKIDTQNKGYVTLEEVQSIASQQATMQK